MQKRMKNNDNDKLIDENKDEEKDKLSWSEYLENVMKKRGSAWLPLYHACRELES